MFYANIFKIKQIWRVFTVQTKRSCSFTGFSVCFQKCKHLRKWFQITKLFKFKMMLFPLLLHHPGQLQHNRTLVRRTGILFMECRSGFRLFFPILVIAGITYAVHRPLPSLPSPPHFARFLTHAWPCPTFSPSCFHTHPLSLPPSTLAFVSSPSPPWHTQWSNFHLGN